MFKVNDQVIHSREGLSVIVDIKKMGDNEYFVVKSSRGGNENIYVPVNNASSLIRPIMEVVEADKVLEFMKEVKAEFISNTKQRRDQYKRRLLSGNVLDLAYLSKQLFFYHFYNDHGQVVKLGPTDVQMLREAESILFDELAITFMIDRNEVFEFVSQRLSQ